MAEENQNQIELTRLNRLIQQITADRDLTGQVASRNVSESLSSRGIRGKFSNSRAAEAARLATGGLNRQLERLQNSRTDLQKVIDDEKKALESRPTANAQARSLLDRLNAFNSQSERKQFDPSGPQGIIVGVNEHSPNTAGFTGNRKFGITVNVGGGGQQKTFSFNNFNSLTKKIQELQKQGLQIVLPGLQEALKTDEFKQLDQLGVFRRSDVATQQSFLGRRRQGILGRLQAFNQVARLSGGTLTKEQIAAEKALRGV